MIHVIFQTISRFYLTLNVKKYPFHYTQINPIHLQFSTSALNAIFPKLIIQINYKYNKNIIKVTLLLRISSSPNEYGFYNNLEY